MNLQQILAYADNVRRVMGRNVKDLVTDPENALSKTAANTLQTVQELPDSPSNFLGAGVIKSLRGPQHEAMRLSQQHAALPPEQHGLGLPPDNTPQMRADALGHKDFYHGSKQDITGPFAPVYGDNLAFMTPDPKFASDWIGKGARQQRMGDAAAAEVKAAEDLQRDIRKRTGDWDAISKLEGPEFNAAYDAAEAAAKAQHAKEIGLPTEKIHATVYPLKAPPQKTFNPDENFDDMGDYFAKKGYDSRTTDVFKTGNYLPFETKEVVDHLKNKGYDSMSLRESTGGPFTTMAVFDPSTVRSRFAAFDPWRRNAAVATATGMLAPDLLAEELRKPQP